MRWGLNLVQAGAPDQTQIWEPEASGSSELGAHLLSARIGIDYSSFIGRQLSSAQQRITARRAAGSPSFSTAQRTSGLLISLPPRVSAYHFYRVQTATFALLPGNSSLIRKKKSSIVGGPVICPSTEPLREREVGNGEDESGVWEGEDAGGDGGGRGIPSTSWRWLLLFHGRLQSPVHLVHQTGLFLLLSIYFLKLIGILLHLCGLCDDGRIGIVSSGPWLLRAPRCICSHLFLPQTVIALLSSESVDYNAAAGQR